MKLDEILNELAEAIKLPEPKEEAIAYIQKENMISISPVPTLFC